MANMMLPGPTRVPEEVRRARAQAPDVMDSDPDFVSFYQNTCRRITRLSGGGDDYETIILSGEGMLALEAAVASLTEAGDRVLVLDNGVFGAGFGDLVQLYGGTAVPYTVDDRRPIDPVALGYFLESSHRFKYATLVHCETPTGLQNNIDRLCPLLKSHGILTLVDAVSSQFAEPIQASLGIDLLCGGSQKALSAPPGLSFVTISPAGWAAIQNRKTPIASFYANLQNFAHYYEECWFPYTMPVSDIYGLAAALDLVEGDPDYMVRHAHLARACRGALQKAGLTLYPEGNPANTVTAFCVPEGTTDKTILELLLREHQMMLTGSFGAPAGKVIRIGHMGANCNKEDMVAVMDALQGVLTALGVPLLCDLGATFRNRI